MTLEDIKRLQTEAHETSMEDIYTSTPVQQQPGRSSPGLTFSDIKAEDQSMPVAPSYSAVAAAQAPVASSAPPNAAHQGSSEGSAVVALKEELLAQYRDLGQRVMTEYSYQGERLDLAGLIQAM